MKSDEFWRVTPRQMQDEIGDRDAVLRREHNDRAWMVWHSAALGRAKRLPDLKKLLAKTPHKPRPRQTWQQQLAVMDQWVAATRKQRREE